MHDGVLKERRHGEASQKIPGRCPGGGGYRRLRMLTPKMCIG
jgi:hypothetical protein